MVKVMMLLRKRKDLTREQFMDYYSNHHVPFMSKLLPKGAAVHRRNFIVPPQPAAGGPSIAQGDNEYDAIVEIFYEDMETVHGVARALADPELRRKMEADEDNFLERGSIRRFVVETHETVFRPLAGRGV